MSITQITKLPDPIARPEASHKGTFGRVLIVAGSFGMSGAAVLAGQGALRGGAGLVYLAIPECILSTVAALEPSYLTIPLSTNEHQLAEEASSQIQQRLEGKDALAIGPGMGRASNSDQIIRELFKTCPLPMVVDADALNAFAESAYLLSDHAGPRILTPHPGEFARLTDQSIQEVQKHRVEHAVDFAQTHNVNLVLKGAGTVVTDGDQYYINTTGNPGMATGGTGDVLTGLISALLAGGYDPFPAAQLSVYLHGLAGDLAASELSQPGMIASDLPKFLPSAWKKFLTQPIGL